MDSLLKYATDDEIATVNQLATAVEAAKAEGIRLSQEQWRIKGQIRDRMAFHHSIHTSAARAYLSGGSAAQVAPAQEGPSLAMLQEIDKGLVDLLAQNKDYAQTLRDSHRAAATRLFRECGERAAKDFRKTADDLGKIWLQLSSVARTVDGNIWPDAIATRMIIPRNTGLRAFAVSPAEAYTAHQLCFEGTGMEPQIQAEIGRLRAEAMGVFGSWPIS